MIVDYGKDASFTLSGSTGYHYDNYVCTGANESSYSNNKLTVKNVTDPVTCKVTYSINKYNITINGVNDTYYCDIYTNECAKWNYVYDSCKSGSNTCSYGCDSCSKSYKSGNGGKSTVGSGVTAVENTAGANTSNGKVSLTYYKENL